MTLAAGSTAPAFDLPATGGTVRLSDFHGRQNVLLVFYPADSTPG